MKFAIVGWATIILSDSVQVLCHGLDYKLQTRSEGQAIPSFRPSKRPKSLPPPKAGGFHTGFRVLTPWLRLALQLNCVTTYGNSL